MSTTPSLRSRPTADTATTPALRHRADIQGLRALAVTSVVLYHAGVPGLSGGFVGVDLFFVISGFLITGLLVVEWRRHGRVSLAGFWARRARRILPASTVVLVATAIGTALVVPALQRPAVAGDLTWAALFSANWRFAQQSTDYLAQDRATSPVLHYWSLGVEEQFYLAWPLIVVLVSWVCVRRAPRLVVPALVTVTTVGVVASFLWNLHLTATNQPYAFFGTPARAWQLGVGCLLAVAAHRLAGAGPRLASTLAVVGLAGIAWSFVSLQESGGAQPYPGWLAVVPTLSGALLIGAGISHHEGPVRRLLSLRPLQVLGDLSYSWYLWHFPVLVLGALHFGSSPGVTAALVVLSLGLAWLSYTYVETPLRALPTLARRPQRSLVFGAALVAVALTAALTIPSLGRPPANTVVALDGSRVTLRPAPADAAGDVISMRAAGCDLDFEEVDMPACDFGAVSSDRRVVLLGDSHAVVLFPPLQQVAEKNDWHLNSWTKSACPVSDVTTYNRSRERVFTECDEFRDAILDRVVATRPDVVVIAEAAPRNRRVVDRTSGELLSETESREQIEAGMARVLRRLSEAGIQVVLAVDPPAAPFDPPTCLAEKARVRPCTFRRPAVGGNERAAGSGIAGVTYLDYLDEICGPRRCSPVLGDILVYRDTNHLTRTYAMTLVPRLRRLLGDTA
jgi:peptidoglycan/LPS O-acetylase OafA/YrhL